MRGGGGRMCSLGHTSLGPAAAAARMTEQEWWKAGLTMMGTNKLQKNKLSTTPVLLQGSATRGLPSDETEHKTPQHGASCLEAGEWARVEKRIKDVIGRLWALVLLRTAMQLGDCPALASPGTATRLRGCPAPISPGL